MGPYRILSIDGRGIRGLYAAVLLQRLADAVPGLLATTDLLAGTSTGAIIVLGLAAGLSPADLVALYRDNVRQIFDDSGLRDLRDVGGLAGARYDNAALRQLLQDKLGADRRLQDLPRRVLVPSFDLDNGGMDGQPRMWKPKFFHNFPGPDSDGAELVVDVAMRSSAAPTYFPTYQHYVDGGVVANNPSMAAVAQALDPRAANRSLDDIRLFSLSTGTNPEYIEAGAAGLDWGIGQWARPLVDLMIDGMMGVADFQCAQLLGPRYRRLDGVLPQAVTLDAVDRANDLMAFAQGVPLDSHITWLTDTFLGAAPAPGGTPPTA
jgi:patatin-like phospholipase/acyl hydrolase